MIQPNIDNSNQELETNDNLKLQQKVEKIGDFSLNILRSLSLWRWIGYGFLILFCFDLIEILVPPNLLNPRWEFQTMGAIIERMAIPLIAILLIFYGGNYLRSRGEVLILKILSWLTLLVGIVLILLIPLGIVNTVRIDRQNTNQIQQQVDQRREVLQELETRLEQVQTQTEMELLLNQISRAGNAPEIQDVEQLKEIKENLAEFIENSRTQITNQSETTRQQQRLSLLESSVKWNLGALISAFLWFTAWRLTKWARVPEKQKKK